MLNHAGQTVQVSGHALGLPLRTQAPNRQQPDRQGCQHAGQGASYPCQSQNGPVLAGVENRRAAQAQAQVAPTHTQGIGLLERRQWPPHPGIGARQRNGAAVRVIEQRVRLAGIGIKQFHTQGAVRHPGNTEKQLIRHHGHIEQAHQRSLVLLNAHRVGALAIDGQKIQHARHSLAVL